MAKLLGWPTSAAVKAVYNMTQISGIAERIKGGLGAGTRVFLFGSYAWGEPNEDSDLDFAVVVPD